MHVAAHLGDACRRRAHVRGPCHRRRRQRRREPREPHYHRRHGCPADDDRHRPERPDARRDADVRVLLASRARPSSAASTRGVRRLQLAAHHRRRSPTASHTLRGPRHDAAGNADATPASRTITVDTAAPQTTIDTGPSGLHDATRRRRSSSPPSRARPSSAASTPPPSPPAAHRTPPRRSATASTPSTCARPTRPGTLARLPATPGPSIRRRRRQPSTAGPSGPTGDASANIRVLVRTGRQLRVPHRRRRLRHLHIAAHHGRAHRRPAHLRGTRHRRRRQHRHHAGEPDLHGRYDAAGHGAA